jgi:hypothetical protein
LVNERPLSELRVIEKECHARENGHPEIHLDSLFRGNDKFEASFGEFTRIDETGEFSDVDRRASHGSSRDDLL